MTVFNAILLTFWIICPHNKIPMGINIIKNGDDLMFICINLKKAFKTVIGIAAAVILLVPFIGLIKGKSVSAMAEDKGIFLPAIMYHSVLIEPARQGAYVISPKIFESDMKWLSDNGYTAVLTDDLTAYTEKGAPLPEKPIMITFDDGFYNNVTYALPVLEKYGMKAVISPVGSYCEESSESGDANPAYAYLTWDEIAELKDSPYIEIGNHTWNMHSTDGRKGSMKKWNESETEYKAALTGDLSRLQTSLAEKSGVVPKIYAYPFGYISRESISVLKELGFKASLNCYEKPNYITRDPDCLFSINRYNRPADISTEEFFAMVTAQ